MSIAQNFSLAHNQYRKYCILQKSFRKGDMYYSGISISTLYTNKYRTWQHQEVRKAEWTLYITFTHKNTITIQIQSLLPIRGTAEKYCDKNIAEKVNHLGTADLLARHIPQSRSMKFFLRSLNYNLSTTDDKQRRK
jgi:hypothetical protein